MTRHINFSSPLSNRLAAVIERDSDGVASVIRLLPCGCPAAISRFIVAVVVDAVKRVTATRSQPHVVVEVFKRVSPTVTNLDTTAAIIGVARITLVGTPRNQPVPRFVLGCSCQAMLPFMMVTSATSCFPGDQARRGYGLLVAALAAAQPYRVLIAVIAQIAYYSQVAETPVEKIVPNRLGNGYNPVSHFCTSIADLVRGLEGVRCTFQSLLFYHKLIFGQNAL